MLRLLISVIFLVLLISCSKVERPDIVFDDFENENYQNWNIQGFTFTKPLQKDSLKLDIKNAHGQYVAYSFFDSDTTQWYQGKNQGKLVSKPFIIDRDYIQFLIAGGRHNTRECINLMINNKVVRYATGKNNNTLRSVLWDVKDLQGEKAILEIVDALGSQFQDNALGYVLIDHITFTDNVYKKEWVFEDFESGTYNNWTVEGDAFEIPRNRTNVYYPISANGFNGKYFAFSFSDTHDVKQGKLTSKTFTVNHDYLKFLVGGGNHIGKTCINFIVNDSVVYTAQGSNDGEMRPVKWNIKTYKGQHAKIEIVDNYSGSWGHIMVDDIILFNTPVFYKTYRFWGVLILSLIILFVLIKYLNSKTKKESKHLSQIDSESLKKFERLKSKISDSECYKNPSITIKEISKITSFNTKEINDLFETIEKSTITNYLNILRVSAFKKELKDPENKAYTMISIAEKCGFNSKTSFYRVFKSITNMTPSEYKKTL